MKAFVDTNILLDVLARHEPFYADSAHIWTLAETGRIVGFISALSLPNLYYLLRKPKGRQDARKAIATLRTIFTLVPLDAQMIHEALDADIADFEDAIQFFSAMRAGASTLISRNPRDFPRGDIAIHTPAEFLAAHFSK